MSESTPFDNSVASVAPTRVSAAPPGVPSFLLQPEPDALLEVVLVDQPVDLPTAQFEALLVDSECEV